MVQSTILGCHACELKCYPFQLPVQTFLLENPQAVSSLIGSAWHRLGCHACELKGHPLLNTLPPLSVRTRARATRDGGTEIPVSPDSSPSIPMAFTSRSPSVHQGSGNLNRLASLIGSAWHSKSGPRGTVSGATPASSKPALSSSPSVLSP